MGISLEHVAYVGNDINDIECLKIVGLPVCVADAWPSVKEISRVVQRRRADMVQCGSSVILLLK